MDYNSCFVNNLTIFLNLSFEFMNNHADLFIFNFTYDFSPGILQIPYRTNISLDHLVIFIIISNLPPLGNSSNNTVTNPCHCWFISVLFSCRHLMTTSSRPWIFSAVFIFSRCCSRRCPENYFECLEIFWLPLSRPIAQPWNHV